MRIVLPLLCVALASSPAFAKEQAPIDLRGAPLIVTPPPGGNWKARVDTDAPGQWAVTYQRDAIVLQALVFPIKDHAPTDPRKLLYQAVRIALPTVGVDSTVGTPTLEPLNLLGHVGASATLSARRKGRLHGGRARVLRAGAHWGLAWGILPTGSGVPDRNVVKHFVESMVPKAPLFFTPRFFDPVRLDDILLRPTNEDPIRRRDLLAMERLLETSMGSPMCLSRRELMRRVLLEQATRGDVRFRDGMRSAHEAFKPLEGVTPDKQRQGQIKLAEAIYHGFLQRYVSKDAIAKAYMQVRSDSTRLIGGKPPGIHLRLRDLDNLLEMFGFLASLAADGPREVSAEQRDAFLQARIEAWDKAPEELRKAWVSAGGDWLRLRCAWDRATAEQRLAFRRAVLHALLPAGDAATLAEVKGARALKQWMLARGPLDMAHVLKVAANMTAAQRTTLLRSLPTWPARVPLGW